jgi:hypothetical protein
MYFKVLSPSEFYEWTGVHLSHIETTPTGVGRLSVYDELLEKYPHLFILYGIPLRCYPQTRFEHCMVDRVLVQEVSIISINSDINVKRIEYMREHILSNEADTFDIRTYSWYKHDAKTFYYKEDIGTLSVGNINKNDVIRYKNMFMTVQHISGDVAPPHGYKLCGEYEVLVYMLLKRVRRHLHLGCDATELITELAEADRADKLDMLIEGL